MFVVDSVQCSVTRENKTFFGEFNFQNFGVAKVLDAVERKNRFQEVCLKRGFLDIR